MAILPFVNAFGAVLHDPGVPDGEKIVWRVNKEGSLRRPSTIIFYAKELNGRPVYEIVEDSGERKQAKYIIDRSDLRLIEAQLFRNTNKGPFKAKIDVRGKRQYLVYTKGGKKPKDKKIDHYPDGYNGLTLPFCLRGFPFGKKKEVKLHLTPPLRPEIPGWAWRMWKSRAKYLGMETVTVPAGTFECHKLEVEATSGLIKRVTSKYYFWYAKDPPHHFVKYQDEDGKNITELMEIEMPDVGK